MFHEQIDNKNRIITFPIFFKLFAIIEIRALLLITKTKIASSTTFDNQVNILIHCLQLYVHTRGKRYFLR